MSVNTISVKDNFPQVAKWLESLTERQGNRAMVRTLNRTVVQGKVSMARAISKEYRIKYGVAKERLNVIYAYHKGQVKLSAKLVATWGGKGRSMNLIHFVTKMPRVLKSGELTQLGFQIKRDGGRKEIKGAFIGNQGRTVFIRTGKKRLPIKALNTIDVPQMFNSRKLHGIVKAEMIERFEKNFIREFKAELRGFVK